MGICGARGSDHHPTEGHFSLSLFPSVGFRPGVQGWQGKEKEGERDTHRSERCRRLSQPGPLQVAILICVVCSRASILRRRWPALWYCLLESQESWA